jgi:DNA primase
MAIDQRVIDEITAATDIVQVIGSAIPLRRAGSNFKAQCPFHQEKTASLMVSPQKQIFHCFGCGAGGNVFSFLMKYENLSFPETIRLLAEKANITIPDDRHISKEKGNEVKKIADIFQVATEYYRANFENQEIGKLAREYFFEKRAFSKNISANFSVGYASSEWGALSDLLQKKGFPLELIMRSGLVVRSQKGTLFDFFRGRILFPIFNIRDKVVGFGGRTLGSDEPKYINTPETEYFRKRYELYGLNFARREVHANQNTILVVEGYLDVIALHQAEIKNVVAPLGTALTHDHVKLLRRYADKVIMVFDGDKAGLNAALRSIDIFLEEELHAEVVTLPTGYDPDSFVKEKGREAFVEILTQSMDVFDFKLDALIKEYNPQTAFGLMKIAREMLTSAHIVKNAILLDRYIKKLAAKLRIEESAIRDELKKKKGISKNERSHEESVISPKRNAKFEEELTLMYIITTHPHLMKTVFESVDSEDLERPEAREIYLLLQRLVQERNLTITLDTLINHVPTEETQKVLSEFAFHEIEEDTIEEALQNRLREVKLRSYDRKITKVKQAISEAVTKQDDAMRTQYQKIHIELERERQKLKSKDLGIRI